MWCYRDVLISQRVSLSERQRALLVRRPKKRCQSVNETTLFLDCCSSPQGFNESNVPRLLIKDSDRTIVSRLSVLMRVANCSQACPSQFAQGAHHVKNNACLAGLIKMQVMPHHNVEQVVRSKSPIARRFDVIAGYKEFLLTIRSCEDARLRIVSSVG